MDAKGRDLIEDLHQRVWQAIDSTPGLAQTMRDLEELGLRLLGINFQLVVLELESPRPAAQTDEDFLRSLRISPGLSTEEPGEQPR